ncbi:MAG: hypothetical protein ACOCXQ_01265 [Patescibacteria group bacterium]
MVPSTDNNYTGLPGHLKKRIKKRRSWSIQQISNLSLVVAIVVFVGSITFAIQQAQTSVNTRASTDDLGVGIAGPGNVNETIRDLTLHYESYPTAFNNEPIPQSVISEAEEIYADSNATTRQQYITNRLILYYAFKDVAEKHNLQFAPTSPVTFTGIEKDVPILLSLVKENLISTADFAFIKAYFNSFPNKTFAQQRLGINLRPTAERKIEYYKERLETYPEDYLLIIEEANNDEELQLLNNFEPHTYVEGYTADQNNIPSQEFLIFDEEFDTFIFNLKPNNVSNMLLLNSANPYLYIVVYPTDISLKEYNSYKEILAQYDTSFTF